MYVLELTLISKFVSMACHLKLSASGCFKCICIDRDVLSAMVVTATVKFPGGVSNGSSSGVLGSGSQINKEKDAFLEVRALGGFLVIRWLRIRHAMQGTLVRPLTWEDRTYCRATKSVCRDC